MPAGHLSWYRRVGQVFSRKEHAAKKDFNKELPCIPPEVILETERYASPEFQEATRMKSDDESSERTVVDTPSEKQAKKQAITNTKPIQTLLENLTSIIPAPILQEVIGVGLKVVALSKEALTTEQQVRELQERARHMTVIIMTPVSDKADNDDKELVVRATKDIEDGVKEILHTLGTITKDIGNIKDRHQWVIKFYKDASSPALNDCTDALLGALEAFKLANGVHDSDLVLSLQSDLEVTAKQVGGLSEAMKRAVSAMEMAQERLCDARHAFDRFMTKVKRSAVPFSSQAKARQDVPLKPEVFYGRDSLVEEISMALVQPEASRVCILGPGGMGKTSVALAAVDSHLVRERFSYDERVWVPCIAATSATLLLDTLHTQLELPSDRRVTLDNIVSYLGGLDKPVLLLMDNFEAPWTAPGNQQGVANILRQLAELKHVVILMTMRGSYPPCDNSITWLSKKIEHVDEESSLRIFHEINPRSKDDPDVVRLLQTLGHMPFAVTLMASLGKEARYHAVGLLEAWSESGPDIISNDGDRSMNKCIGLSVESKLVKENPSATLLLSVLSMLPAGTTKENLRWWAPMLKTTLIPSAIAALSKAALLVEDNQGDSDSRLLVVPVVQSFMQQHSRISDDIREQVFLSCCQYVLDHARRFDETGFKANSKALAVEESNIQSILFDLPLPQDASSSETAIEALISFCWYRCDTNPSLTLARRVLAEVQASGIEGFMAAAEWCLGRTYHLVGSRALAFKHLQRAYQLFAAPGDLEWRKARCRCGINLIDTAYLLSRDKASAVCLARQVEAKSAALSDDLIHGRALLYLGFALQAAHQTEEALECMGRAMTMLEARGSALDVAEAYQGIARAHYSRHRLPEALVAIGPAWEQAELTGNASIEADIALEYGEILLAARMEDEAMKFLEVALKKYSHVGNQFQVGSALEFIAYGFLQQRDYCKACRNYDAAADKYFVTGNTWCMERCKENMSRIEQKLRNTDVVIGFHRPAVDYDETLSYHPAQPSAVGDLPTSAC